MSERSAEIERETSETRIELTLDLDGEGRAEIDSGIAFFDHMLETVAKHGRFDLRLTCDGDLEVDDHHTVEDCSLVLGDAFDEALGTRKGIERFGHAYAPLDEALSRVVVDLSGRPFSVVDLCVERDSIGGLACENLPHVFRSFATNVRGSVHVDVLRGENDHHRIESAFKAFALAMRQATRSSGGDDVPSTKGVL